MQCQEWWKCFRLELCQADVNLKPSAPACLAGLQQITWNVALRAEQERYWGVKQRAWSDRKITAVAMKVTNTREPSNTATLHQRPADNLSRPVCRFILMDFLPLRDAADGFRTLCVCVCCLFGHHNNIYQRKHVSIGPFLGLLIVFVTVTLLQIAVIIISVTAFANSENLWQGDTTSTALSSHSPSVTLVFNRRTFLIWRRWQKTASAPLLSLRPL